MTRQLVLATGNPGKLHELRDLLTGWEVLPKPDHLEIAETGATFVENARLKALGVAQATGAWAIGDDSGLEVLALGGQPGIYSARWGKNDQERMARLLQEMSGKTDRRARFVASIVLACPEGILCEAAGVCVGELLTMPRGTEGFGYDPIFYYPPLARTLAEMTLQEKQQISHRGQALRQLLVHLQAALLEKML
ncbi:RdgB/HAM1 family non-canonical purine NTP pyrophosphatase [Anthocerotibacter panamensis]|uniref:RdgB/HAM1 family non-canonical purine NTP pyrophosphatase n=1 Tax=Anthocerotibacter panamensis TaxID=2857077 RepID=UPI001C4021DA|nr:RdgB/HAM1 family non-canonical purine NTP pyrophosphatase [Anthocerotibacter panamensis]